MLFWTERDSDAWWHSAVGSLYLRLYLRERLYFYISAWPENMCSSNRPVLFMDSLSLVRVVHDDGFNGACAFTDVYRGGEKKKEYSQKDEWIWSIRSSLISSSTNDSHQSLQPRLTNVSRSAKGNATESLHLDDKLMEKSITTGLWLKHQQASKRISVWPVHQILIQFILVLHLRWRTKQKQKRIWIESHQFAR